MSKKQATVSIRVSPEARKKLKLMAIHKGTTIIAIVEALLKTKA